MLLFVTSTSENVPEVRAASEVSPRSTNMHSMGKMVALNVFESCCLFHDGKHALNGKSLLYLLEGANSPQNLCLLNKNTPQICLKARVLCYRNFNNFYILTYFKEAEALFIHCCLIVSST